LIGHSGCVFGCDGSPVVELARKTTAERDSRPMSSFESAGPTAESAPEYPKESEAAILMLLRSYVLVNAASLFIFVMISTCVMVMLRSPPK
jgi:hypothetical protein